MKRASQGMLKLTESIVPLIKVSGTLIACDISCRRSGLIIKLWMVRP